MYVERGEVGRGKVSPAKEGRDTAVVVVVCIDRRYLAIVVTAAEAVRCRSRERIMAKHQE